MNNNIISDYNYGFIDGSYDRYYKPFTHSPEYEFIERYRNKKKYLIVKTNFFDNYLMLISYLEEVNLCIQNNIVKKNKMELAYRRNMIINDYNYVNKKSYPRKQRFNYLKLKSLKYVHNLVLMNCIVKKLTLNNTNIFHIVLIDSCVLNVESVKIAYDHFNVSFVDTKNKVIRKAYDVTFERFKEDFKIK